MQMSIWLESVLITPSVDITASMQEGNRDMFSRGKQISEGVTEGAEEEREYIDCLDKMGQKTLQ